MKAIVISAFGGPECLVWTERPVPPVQDSEILIRVQAAGVNRPDIAQRKGSYPAPPGAPADIPGLEVAGIVEKVGASVRSFLPGQSVCALLAGGGYAEYVSVDAGLCLPAPPGLSWEQAAGLPEAVCTVWHNVFERGQLRAGENFLIHGGSGGIGMAAIQLANLFGARVFATAGSNEKCAFCTELGAFRSANYRSTDFEAAFQPDRMDLILDMIGGDYFQKNLNLLKEEGRLIYINAMKGRRVELDLFHLMQKRIHLSGSTLRNRSLEFKARLVRQVRQYIWPKVSTGHYQSRIFATFPLAQAADAHRLMESGQHTGKIVLLIDQNQLNLALF